MEVAANIVGAIEENAGVMPRMARFIRISHLVLVCRASSSGVGMKSGTYQRQACQPRNKKETGEGGSHRGCSRRYLCRENAHLSLRT